MSVSCLLGWIKPGFISTGYFWYFTSYDQLLHTHTHTLLMHTYTCTHTSTCCIHTHIAYTHAAHTHVAHTEGVHVNCSVSRRCCCSQPWSQTSSVRRTRAAMLSQALMLPPSTPDRWPWLVFCENTLQLHHQVWHTCCCLAQCHAFSWCISQSQQLSCTPGPCVLAY